MTNIFMVPVNALDSLIFCIERMIRCYLVSILFDTDMASASTLLHEYYGQVVWIEDGALPVSEDDDASSVEDEDEVVPADDEPILLHPPLDAAFLAETIYTIPFEELER